MADLYEHDGDQSGADEHEQVENVGGVPKPDGLDAIAAEAELFERGAASAAEPGEELPAGPSSYECAEWIEAAHMAASALFEMHPKLEAEWTKEKIDKWGAAFAKVAKRMGWTFAGLLTNPWVGLAFASYSLGGPLVRVIREDAAEKLAGGSK